MTKDKEKTSEVELADEVTDSSIDEVVVAPPKTPKQTNKGLIALLISLGVIGFLLIIAVVVYFVFFHISSADYRHASGQTKSLIEKYHKVAKASKEYMDEVADSDSSDDDITEKKEAYKKIFRDYQDGVNQLAHERAMRNGKIKTAYDTLVKKNKSFVDNITTLEQSAPALHKAVVSCDKQKIGNMDTDDLGKLVSAYDTAIGPCSENAKELAEVSNADVAKLGKKLGEYFGVMRERIVNMEAAYKANDRAKFEAEYKAFIAKAKSFEKDTDLTSVQEHQKSLGLDGELKALVKVIDQQ